MTEYALPPEVCLTLQIQLDKLTVAEERCRQGLYDLSSGRLSREDYMELVRLQRAAQKDWETQHRKYLLGDL